MNKKQFVSTVIIFGAFIFMYVIPYSLSREVSYVDDSKVIVKERINSTTSMLFFPCIESISIKVKVIEKNGSKDIYNFNRKGNKIYWGPRGESWLFEEYVSRGNKMLSEFIEDFSEYMLEQEELDNFTEEFRDLMMVENLKLEEHIRKHLIFESK